jgi:SAM-dependent methyltransferase
MPRFRAGGALLEIGCGAGDRLVMLRDRGWTRLTGIDVVAAAAETARSRGLEVLHGNAHDQLVQIPDASLDVVIASMVLEHLPSPFAVVDLLARKLKPGGEFLFSTVARDSLDATLYGAYWAGYDFPRHLVFFTRADIRRMVADQFVGLEEFSQNAPIDFVRASTWRAPEGRLDDRLVVAAPPRALRVLGGCVAWLGRSTRASFRCVRA